MIFTALNSCSFSCPIYFMNDIHEGQGCRITVLQGLVCSFPHWWIWKLPTYLFIVYCWLGSGVKGSRMLWRFSDLKSLVTPGLDDINQMYKHLIKEKKDMKTNLVVCLCIFIMIFYCITYELKDLKNYCCLKWNNQVISTISLFFFFLLLFFTS